LLGIEVGSKTVYNIYAERKDVAKLEVEIDK
jgi:hypothetical protein